MDVPNVLRNGRCIVSAPRRDVDSFNCGVISGEPDARRFCVCSGAPPGEATTALPAIPQIQIDTDQDMSITLEGLDCQQVMASPSLRQQVQDEAREAVAEQLGVTPQEVEVDAVCGSLVLHVRVRPRGQNE